MSSAEWRAAGAAIVHLDEITALVLIGDSAIALSAVSRGAASAAAPNRRVAIFDLADAFALEAPDGLLSAFRDGRSLNALAQSLDDTADCFVVPCGPGTVDAALAAHERWPRLIDGFRATGALLILTVRPEFEGIDDFARLGDRALDLRGSGEDAFLEQRSRKGTPAAAPVASARARVPRRNHAARWVGGAVAVAVIAGGWTMVVRRTPRAAPAVALKADSLAVIDARQSITPATALPAVVNPRDSARAARWGVELVATNDRTDANFRLAEHGALPAGTVSPVLLGGDTAPWYKVVAGAFVDRTAAELLRATLRRVGTLDAAAGVVSRVPYALRLDTALTPALAKARANAYGKRGIAAYALQDDDGRATIYAGAFASPEQTVVLIAELHTAGMAPDLAFRVGRTY